MKELKIKAYAKINLTLDVLGKRADGYHELQTIMQTIDLADIITLRELNQGIKIVSSSLQIPTDEKNLAYQAAQLIKSRAGIEKGIEIRIEKNIPVMAGLAGGSTDAAATLVGLNNLWELDFSEAELWEMAARLGSDVAFCLNGGTCLAEGRGEILKPLNPPPPLWLVLVKPQIGVSTAQVYRSLSLDRIGRRPSQSAMIKALEDGDPRKIAENLVNVLETVTLEMHPSLAVIKEEMMSLGALGALMSGSGPSIFALTSAAEAAQAIAEKMEKSLKEVFVTTTLGRLEKRFLR